VLGVAAAHCVVLGRSRQLVPAEVAQRLRHRESPAVGRRLDASHQREVHERLERPERVRRPYGLHGVQRDRTRERAEAGEQDLVLRGEQAVRPLECRLRAPVAFGRVTGHIAQHVGGRFQTAQQLRGREHGDAGGRQLDCEREPADAFAHVRHRGGLIRRGAPAGRGGVRALGEQCRRGLGRERVERHDGLTAHVQRRLAGDEHAQVPSAFEQRGDGGTGGQDLLEVVEHEQRPPLAQPRREAGRQFAGLVSELERAGDGGQDAGGIADRRERDHERAAGQIVEQPAR
jgi:hypothetical protein